MPIDFPRDYDPRFRPVRFLSSQKEAEMCADFYHWKPDNAGWDDFDFRDRCLKSGVFKHWESGNIIPGYHRVIEKGFGWIRRECEEALKTAAGDARDFIRSIQICAEACTRYLLRYRDLAWKRSLETSNPLYKNQIEKIALACDHISTEPASDFFEAIQLLWLTHEVMYNESVPTSTSLGRVKPDPHHPESGRQQRCHGFYLQHQCLDGGSLHAALRLPLNEIFLRLPAPDFLILLYRDILPPLS